MTNGSNMTIRKVLVIEDNKEFRLMLRDMLEETGCRVIEAEDGNQGIALGGSTDIGLVITDILMPNKEGIETIMKLREMKPDMKIVAMSGGGSMQNMMFLDMASELGADCTLQKPFGMTDVREIIHDTFG